MSPLTAAEPPVEIPAERSQADVPVVALLGPVIGGPLPHVTDLPNALNVLDAVFHRDDESQRRAVLLGQWRTVHLITQQSLRVQHAFYLETDVIATVRRLHADVRGQVFAAGAH